MLYVLSSGWSPLLTETLNSVLPQLPENIFGAAAWEETEKSAIIKNAYFICMHFSCGVWK